MVGCDDKALSHAGRRVVRPPVTQLLSLVSPLPHGAWRAPRTIWGAPRVSWGTLSNLWGAPRVAKDAPRAVWGVPLLVWGAPHRAGGVPHGVKNPPQTFRGAPHFTRGDRFSPQKPGFLPEILVLPPNHPFSGPMKPELPRAARRTGFYLHSSQPKPNAANK